MATEVKLPRLGQGMESGTIVKWLKSEGEPVEKGDPLYELDTDKVTQEVEAEASGVLIKISVSEGEVEVGRTIAFIGEEGEEVEAPAEPSEDGDAARAAPKAEAREREPAERGAEPEAQPEAQPDAQQETAVRQDGASGRVKASPLARRIARERGIELAAIAGTGPEGRVVAEDVERAAAAAAPAPGAAPPTAPVEAEVVELSSMRRTIARRMTEAWQAPAFQLEVSADMTAALALRARLKEIAGDRPAPTVSDVLTKLAAAALLRHRDVNATWADNAVQLHPNANIGLAVALPNGGLVVPVIRGCERLSIAEIAAARAEVVQRARDGKLRQDDLEGGTFTISNLGMYGVDRFTAVLNPPQAAILAVGRIEERAVVVDGEIAARAQMDLVLTCDHRSLTGAPAAEFLATLKGLLEEPALAL
jgi:pyruvate dehydrogenase E2 component (dihydrolipoyllysine-residue acetyltransferase)